MQRIFHEIDAAISKSAIWLDEFGGKNEREKRDGKKKGGEKEG